MIKSILTEIKFSKIQKETCKIIGKIDECRSPLDKVEEFEIIMTIVSLQYHLQATMNQD